ncbi:glycoside hydrolase family 2 [bacterium]|nr:glycoside hydrolase family 2 [bacterium]
MKKKRLILLLCCSFAVLQSQCISSGKIEMLNQTIQLTEGWDLLSSKDIEDISQLHRPEWQSDKAYQVSVPSTIFGALVDLEVYADPFMGTTLKEIDKSPFQVPWFYRKVFDLDPDLPQSNIELELEGFNFRANVWLNGHQIGDADTLIGPFKMYSLNITQTVKPENNVLLIEIIRPEKDDLTIGWVDWNPYPPDDNIGLWRPVKIKQTGTVSLTDIFVQADVNLETLKEADLSISAFLVNHSQTIQTGKLDGQIEDHKFSIDYSLKPGEKRKIIMTAETHAALHFDNPCLWWPHLMGDHPLYNLNMQLMANGLLTDQSSIRFGIREVGDYINEQGHRGWTVNGKKVLIRGGGWVDDLFLREDANKVEAQLQYAAHMNLNTIRLEGFWGSSQTIYERCDELGLLLMIGWSCHWEWENYVHRPTDNYLLINTPEEIEFHTQSYCDQVIWARNHPSVLVWVFGSDMLPRPELERALLHELDEVDPGRPTLAGCRQTAFGGAHDYTSEVSGPVAVKMTGPYSYVTPNYWYVDKSLGGAFGFNTETGPGLQPAVLESVKKFTPKDKLWPLNDVWDFHCGRSVFASFDYWLKPFDKRYGRGNSVEEFTTKAQVANYEAIRAMFEAFAVNKPEATGVIQWMFNSCWPCHLWQLFDYYLMPTGAFYGTRQACQPLNIIYNYGDHSIYLTNEFLDKRSAMQAEIRILDINSHTVFEKTITVNADAQSSLKILTLPQPADLSTTYFLDLKLKDIDGTRITGNFYWLSTQEDKLDFAKSTWYVTPNSSYADFTGLNDLHPVKIDVTHKITTMGKKQKITVTLENSEESLAFFIELKIAGDNDGLTILPIFWEDNYFSLIPGEKRIVSAEYNVDDLKGQRPVFTYSGLNLISN